MLANGLDRKRCQRILSRQAKPSVVAQRFHELHEITPVADDRLLRQLPFDLAIPEKLLVQTE